MCSFEWICLHLEAHARASEFTVNRRFLVKVLIQLLTRQ